ncbi:CU044_5270 family protein [Kitasatospora sp. NPDC004615]|uniref:CU044_5270 family protein n=1 Tax=Kitasatospora sp. NPDC004615 TaxID=3364017 RepID=UPI0036CBA4CE
MNASPSQPHPADRPETDGLRPTAERNLPAGRHQFHKEQLMAQIHEDLNNAVPAPVRRNPFLRRAILLPAAGFALAGAVAAGAVLIPQDHAARPAAGPALTGDIGNGDQKGAVQLLNRISLAAAEAPSPAVRPGQYVYLESQVAGINVKDVDGKPTPFDTPLHTRRMWTSDNHRGWLSEPQQHVDAELELLRIGRLEWPTYEYLASLPTDPDALLKKIREEIAYEGQGGPDAEAFIAIGTLLRDTYLPAPVMSALYKAAAKIPGVVVVDDAVDAIGRHGVAVARTKESNGQRSEWIFDKSTFAFLGERTVQVGTPAPGQVVTKPGTVLVTAAVTKRAVVNEIKQIPSDQA